MGRMRLDIEVNVEKARDVFAQLARDMTERLNNAVNISGSSGGSRGSFLSVISEFQKSFVKSLERLYSAVGIVLMVEILKRMEQYFGKFSGYLKAGVQLVDTFVNLLFKPLADIIGMLLIPILLPLIRMLVRILPHVEKVLVNWSSGGGGTFWGALGNLALGGIGYAVGGFPGAIAGLMLPAIINSIMDWIGSKIGIEIPDWLKTFVAEGGTLYLLVKGFGKLSTSLGKLVGVIGSGSEAGTVVGAFTALSSALTGLLGALGIVGAGVGIGYTAGKIMREMLNPVNQMVEWNRGVLANYNVGGLMPVAQTVSYTSTGSAVTAYGPSGYIVDKNGNVINLNVNVEKTDVNDEGIVENIAEKIWHVIKSLGG